MSIELTLVRKVPARAELVGVAVTSDEVADEPHGLDWAVLKSRGFDGSVGQVLRFGELPEELHTIMDAGKVQGILGTEMLKHFGLCLSLREGVMKLDTLYRGESLPAREAV